MRYFSTLLATVAILVACAAAQTSGYEAICPSLDDGKPHQIVPFYFVEYKCGMLGPNDGDVKLAKSAAACAIFCKEAGPKCTGSSWMEKSGTCLLSGSQQGKPAPSYIYMKRVPYEEVIKYCRDHPEEKDCYGIA